MAERFRANRPAVAAAVVLLLLGAFAFVGPLVWTWDHRLHATIVGDLSPRWSHPFGTSRAGHDLLGQVMRGTQQSLKVAAVAGVMTGGVGGLWGAIAGFVGGWVDGVLMRIVDVVLVVPLLLVVLVLAGDSAGTTWWPVAVVVGAFGWAGTARIVRSVTLTVRELDFVAAARALGAGPARIVARHVLPHVLPFVVIDAMIGASAAVLVEASLSFVGFGIVAPDTSLGLLVADAQTSVTTRPWLFWIPGAFLTTLCLCLNLVGDGIRDALDPRAAPRP